MTLFGEIRSFADDVVATIVDGNDISEFSLCSRTNGNTISHSNRIGGADAFQAKVTFHPAFHDVSFIGTHHIAASSVANDNAVALL